MKALTLTQPWATLMATHRPSRWKTSKEPPWKTIETRSWRTDYRGELVIHAAKCVPEFAARSCEHQDFVRALDGRSARELPASVGLCVVRVVGCVRTEDVWKVGPDGCPTVEELAFGDYSPGRFAWLTEYLRPLENQTPVRGALGLWDWDAALAKQRSEAGIQRAEALSQRALGF